MARQRHHYYENDKPWSDLTEQEKEECYEEQGKIAKEIGVELWSDPTSSSDQEQRSDEQQTRNIQQEGALATRNEECGQTSENRWESFEEAVQQYARSIADQHAQEEAKRATPSSNQEREPAPRQAQVSEEDQPLEDQFSEYSEYNP